MQRGSLDGLEPHWTLREEAQESWHYVVSDKMVYGVDAANVALNPFVGIAESYGNGGNSWIECHLVFIGERNFHFAVIIEALSGQKLRRGSTPINRSPQPVNWDSSVLINYAQFIQSPEKVRPDEIYAIPSIIRLKRFDNFDCFRWCPRSLIRESLGVRCFQNGELRHLRIGSGNVSKIPNQLIKRSTEVVEDVPCNERNRIRNFDAFHCDDVQSMFNIILTSKSAGIFVKDSNLLPQVFKMYLRPRCLEIGIGQTQRHIDKC